MRYDHFVPQLTEQPADPRGMGSCLQGHETPRYFSKGLLHRFRCRRQFLFQNDLACFIQNTVERPAISKVQTNRELVSFENHVSVYPNSASLFHKPVSFSLCLEHVEHWERIASRRRPAFSSHLRNGILGNWLFSARPHSDKTSCAVGAPPSMKIEFSGLVRGGGSICDTSNVGWRLLGGRESAVWALIPSIRLTRVGKGTTFCHTQRLGRTYSSVCNRPTAQQSPPLRRRRANPSGTWLRDGCAPGHRGGLLVGCFERRESPKADTHVWHDDARVADLARMVALGRLHSCGDGEHGSVLEADLRHPGRSLPDRGGQRTTRQEGSRAQDRRERCGMDRGFTLPRAAAFQFRAASAHPGTP